jgi:redox-sensitive bicupin YhaK (pirin superfamily)
LLLAIMSAASVTGSVRALSSAILRREESSFPLRTLDPFLFCVFHLDMYPSGDPAHMRAPIRGDGADFTLTKSKPFRMYHGEGVPGFPVHPHRGFETLTVTLQGLVDHADSIGASGRYGEGDLQWMNAGRGVQHQEMFPLVKVKAPNTLKLYQLWLNLPARSKMSQPEYKMQWAENVRSVAGEGGAKALCYVGRLGEAVGAEPPPQSWAADASHHVGVFILCLPPGGGFTLPPEPGAGVQRMAYVTMGSVEGVESDKTTLTLDPTKAHPFTNTGAEYAEVLVLQGVPIGEPVAQQGPFVMNTRAELAKAYSDFRETGFGVRVACCPYLSRATHSTNLPCPHNPAPRPQLLPAA